MIGDLTLQQVRTVIQNKVIGRILPQHDEFGHHYSFPNGKVVDSVTQKIHVPRPHLLKWYAHKALEYMEPFWPTLIPENREATYVYASLAGERERDLAGNTGTAGHDAIEAWINEWIATSTMPENILPFVKPDKDSKINSAAVAVARSAQKFFKDHPYYLPVYPELLVGDEKYGVAGSLDILLYDTRTAGIVVGDWKSSNSIDQGSYSMQVAAYRHCLAVMTGLSIDRTCLILKLSKDKDAYDIYKLRAPGKAFSMYRHSAAISDWLGNGKEKLVKDKVILKI